MIQTIILYYLAGNERLRELLEGIEVHVSFITVVELLSYPSLDDFEETKINEFLNDCIIETESEDIRELTIGIRKNYKLNIPDAFIAATSILYKIPLFSADNDFLKVSELSFIDFEV
ncbi:MAG: PIN domain-containing protein [Gracilimonas sp.]